VTAGSYEDALLELARRREDVDVLTAENRAPIRSLPERLGDRFLDVGICEQTVVGIAAGLALRGRTPVVHALAAFLTMRAFEFIRTDVGIARLPVKLIGSLAGFLSGANGPTHQALEDVALMRGIPGMRVFCPADTEELVAGLPEVVASRQPWYVRYTNAPCVVTHTVMSPTRGAELLSQGGDVALLTYGSLLAQAEGARQILEAGGLRVRLVNLRMLRPIDAPAVLEAAQRTKLLVTIEDHFATGGLATIVAEILVRHGLFARTLALALPDRWFRPALLSDVLTHEGFTAAAIAGRVREAWGGQGRAAHPGVAGPRG
jgi:transketolase